MKVSKACLLEMALNLYELNLCEDLGAGRQVNNDLYLSLRLLHKSSSKLKMGLKI